MKILSFLGLLLLVNVSFSQGKTKAEYDQMLNQEYKRTVPFIKPQELYKKILKGEKMYLLDTREGREYEISAIKGAIHVGFLFFSKRKIETVNTTDLVIVYCTIGARSETIGARLKKSGFQNVYNLYGGIIQWANEGLPVYRNNKKTDEVHVYSKKWGQWLNKGKAQY
jgi:rhodanese-related sulfurtransferase